MKRWWIQELLVVAAIIVVVLLTIFSVHIYNQSIMVHATNIEQGSVYLKYEDKTIDEKLSSQEVKTICSIIDGKKLNTQQIDMYFDENKQIVLGDNIHIHMSYTLSCLYYEEKNAHFSLTEDEQTQIEFILEKYGYNSVIGQDGKIDMPPTITDSVEGFQLSKIHFESIDENFKVNDDQDVIKGLNKTISKWNNSYDSLEFTFYINSDEVANEEWFEEMNYIKIWTDNYPRRIVVEVAYENINVEVLKNLSQRNEISSIYITNPYSVESDAEASTS